MEEEVLKTVVANVQVLLDGKDRKISELEAKLQRLEKEMEQMKSDFSNSGGLAISNEVLELFQPLLLKAKGTEKQDTLSDDQVVDEPKPPALPRGLSASGTDFNEFLRTKQKEIVPVPRSHVETREISPTPKRFESPNLKSKKFHMNDFSALSLKQRRVQRANTVNDSLDFSPSNSSSDVVEDLSKSNVVVPLQSAKLGVMPQQSLRNTQRERRQKQSPTSEDTNKGEQRSKSKLESSGDISPIDFSPSNGPIASPIPTPPSSHLVSSRSSGQFVVAPHDSPTLPPKAKKSSAIGNIPSPDVVNEVLLERFSGASSSGNTNTNISTNTNNSVNKSPNSMRESGSSSLKLSGSGHLRRRSGSHIIDRLISVFPGREHSSKNFESSLDTVPTSDSGFTAHNICFGNRPIFKPPRAFGYEIECHNPAEGSRDWKYNFQLLSVPAALQKQFESIRETVAKYWIWKEGHMILGCYFKEHSENVTSLVISVQRTQKMLFSFPNGHVMPSLELEYQLLPMLNPIIDPVQCTRVRGDELAALKAKLAEFENAVVPQVIDVCVVQGTDSDSKPDIKSPPAPRKRQTCLSRFLSALTKEIDAEVEPGARLSYKWNGIEFRLHCVQSLAQSHCDIVICCVPEETGCIKDFFSAGHNLVVIGVRETQQRFELACCHNAGLSFGPLFFESPVKSRHVQSIISAKILHATTVLPSFSEKRFAAFESILGPVFEK